MSSPSAVARHRHPYARAAGEAYLIVLGIDVGALVNEQACRGLEELLTSQHEGSPALKHTRGVRGRCSASASQLAAHHRHKLDPQSSLASQLTALPFPLSRVVPPPPYRDHYRNSMLPLTGAQ
eukprot:2530304-Rhodomonas_salina.2